MAAQRLPAGAIGKIGEVWYFGWADKVKVNRAAEPPRLERVAGRVVDARRGARLALLGDQSQWHPAGWGDRQLLR